MIGYQRGFRCRQELIKINSQQNPDITHSPQPLQSSAINRLVFTIFLVTIKSYLLN
jgi:hypothetical protein